jgi:TPR repeat protein
MMLKFEELAPRIAMKQLNRHDAPGELGTLEFGLNETLGAENARPDELNLLASDYLLPDDFLNSVNIKNAAELLKKLRRGLPQREESAFENSALSDGVVSEPMEVTKRSSDRLRQLAWEGIALIYGRGRQRNPDLGLGYLREAAEADYPQAQYFIGRAMLDEHVGHFFNVEKGIGWIRAAANAGYGDAQWTLAQLYESGTGMAQDLGEAIRWYFAAASEGHSAAQLLIGLRLSKGVGVSRNGALAAQWLRRAAIQGNRAAQYELVVLLSEGKLEGVSIDRDAWLEACEYLKDAARADYAPAQRLLGQMYGAGSFGNADSVMASYWLERASLSANGDCAAAG